MDEIKKVKYWCYKILPLAYDDSLSYYEVLCRLTAKVNEVISNVNKWYDYGEQIEEIRGLVDAVNGRLDSAKTDLEAQIKANKKNIESNDDDIATLQKKVNELGDSGKVLRKDLDNLKAVVDKINLVVDAWNNYIDARVEALDTKLSRNIYNLSIDFHRDIVEITNRVNELAEKIKHLGYDVYNYSANKRLTFDANNTKLYIDLENAISAEEYCSLNLTADEYKDYQIRAIDYIRDSKKRLHIDWVYMAVSGAKQEISNALTEIINEVDGTLTNDEYIAIGLTAEEYEDLNLDNNAYRKYKPVVS